MRRVLVVLSVFAIAALAAGNVWATATWAFEPDNYFNDAGVYPQIPHDSDSTYYTTLPNGPIATTDGFIWLKTGSGNPALFSGSTLTVASYYKNTSGATGGWTWEENQNADCSSYPGQFVAGSPISVSSKVSAGGIGRYVADDDLTIVGTERIPVTDFGGAMTTFNQGQFYLQMWTGGYATYAAANAASAAGVSGVYVAQTVPFKVDLGGGGTSPFLYCNEFMYMPAVVLQKGVATPEPLTIVLAAAGLLGLVAYAWRKRK